MIDRADTDGDGQISLKEFHDPFVLSLKLPLEKGEVVRVTKKDSAHTGMRAEVLDPKWKPGLIKVAMLHEGGFKKLYPDAVSTESQTRSYHRHELESEDDTTIESAEKKAAQQKAADEAAAAAAAAAAQKSQST